MKEIYIPLKTFVCLQVLAHSLLFSFVGADGVSDELLRCNNATDVPEKVTVAYILFVDDALAFTVQEQEYMNSVSMDVFNREQSLNNDTIVSVEWVQKLYSNWSQEQGPDSAKFAMQAALEVLGDRTLKEDRNLVAVSGGFHAHMCEALNLVSQIYGYPHLDYVDSKAMNNKARFPMFVRINVPSYKSSQMYVDLLRKFDVCKTIVLSSKSYAETSHDFVQRANGAGIEVIDQLQLSSTNLSIYTQRAIELMLEHDVHYIVLFLELWEITPMLAHVHVSQLKARSFDVVWMGIGLNAMHVTYPFAKPFADSYLRDTYEVFAEYNMTYDETMLELQGSFGHHAPLPTGPVADHFNNATKNIAAFMSIHAWLGDIFLAAAHGVRAMNADGYGCHLHSKNFNENVAKKLYEYIIAQKFWGNSGWVEFDSDGNRVAPFQLVNYHGGHLVEHQDPFYDPFGAYAPEFVTRPSIVGNFANNVLALDLENIPIWPNGISSERPGTKPGQSESSCSNEGVWISHHQSKSFSTWVIIVLCVAGAVVFIVIGLLYWSRLSLKKKVKEMQVTKLEAKSKFDLEAPLEKMVKMLDELSKGITPQVAEVNNLKAMFAHGDIMSPNLEEQLRSSSQEIYSIDSIQYVLNTTLSAANLQYTPRFPNLASAFNVENSQSVISDLRSTQSQLVGDSAPFWDFFGKALIKPSPEREAELKSKIGHSLTLETIELYQCTNKRPLQHIAMHVLDVTFNLVFALNLNQEKLSRFLQTIEDGYHASNPYHNNIHAADVTARFAALIFRSELHEILAPEELLAGIIAAIIHDYQHPGSSNSFQVQAKTAVSALYNENHVLENASLFTALELLTRPKTSFTENLKKSQLRKMRKLIIESVLASDLSEHFAVLSDFKSKIPAGAFPKDEYVQPDLVGLILKMGLKCADVGHVSVHLPEHLIWVKSLQAEFYLQGDCEREMGIPISMLMDRRKPRNGPAHGEQQLGFFDFICIPMYEAWVERFPTCSTLTEHLAENRNYWEKDAKQALNSISSGDQSLEIMVERVVSHDEEDFIVST